MKPTKCPKCGARWLPNLHVYGCGSEDDGARSTTCVLNEIIAYCQSRCSPGTNPGGHAVAAKVLEIAGVRNA